LKRTDVSGLFHRCAVLQAHVSTHTTDTFIDECKIAHLHKPATGTNPEQLLGAGWSARFIGAMGKVASNLKVTLPADTAVDAEIDLGTTDSAYFLHARLNVSLPGLPREVAQYVVHGAHQN
jgi:lipoyl-dependent peroxiredoxin